MGLRSFLRGYLLMDKKRHEEEWYKMHLGAIQRLDPEWRREHPVTEGSGIGYSISIPDTLVSFGEFEDDLIRSDKRYPTFSEYILEGIRQRGMTPKEFYSTAKIDRKLFSTIKTKKDYQPKKETAVACCLALGLNSTYADKVLYAAGYSLSMSIQWDRVVCYCLMEGITDIDDVNELLYELGEKLIRQ